MLIHKVKYIIYKSELLILVKCPKIRGMLKMSALCAIMCFEHVSLVSFHNHGYFLLNNLHILPGMDSGCACMHACVCGRAYCYSNKWQVGIVIFFSSIQCSLSLGEPRTMVNGFTLPQDALPLEYITLIALYPHALLSLNVN